MTTMRRSMLARGALLALVLVMLGLAGGLAQGRVEAQNVPPKPEAQEKPVPAPVSLVSAPTFTAAPVVEVLAWAGRNAGMIFMAREGVLDDPASKKPLRVSFNGQGQLEPMQRKLLVFELLRSVGLVPMPVTGMPDGTFMVLKTTEAAGVGQMVLDIDELEGAYFGTIALEAWAIPVKELESMVRKLAGPHAVISVFEPTSKLVIADFVDTLRVIWDAHVDAQTPTERDDDIVTEFVRTLKHDVKSLAVALSASVHPEEDCKVVVHDATGAIMVTGQYRHVVSVLERFDALEAMEILPGQSRVMNLYYPQMVPGAVLATAARGFFAAEVATGTMRFGEIESRKHIVVESSQADWQRVQKFFADNDVPPRSVAEAEQDEAWRERQAAERVAAEREAALKRAEEKKAEPVKRPGLPGLPPDEGGAVPPVPVPAPEKKPEGEGAR